MELNFYKYQGTGNDFVMVDNRLQHFDSRDQGLIEKLCHRRFGIGADGLILLESHTTYDFRMIYFNADGKEGSMCGNGGRCIVQFARDMGVIKKETTFLAVDGEHDAYIEDGLVHLKMCPVSEVEDNDDHFFMNTGSPHYVKFVEEADSFNVFDEGRNIRYNDRFREEGTNVNFVSRIAENAIQVRTYERGVEDETWSCGTGVTASAIAAHLQGMDVPLRVKTKGGDLKVMFGNKGDTFSNVYLIGPAVQVFKGSLAI